MTSRTQHLAQFIVYLNGSPMKKEYMDQVISVEADDSLYLPDMFTIHTKDYGLEILGSDAFKPGTKVKIGIKVIAEPIGEEPPPPPMIEMMIGEVTALEPDLNGHDRVTLVVRGYDKSHRMHRVRKTKTYLQVSDSDVASQLAAGAGLTPKVKSTSVIYPYLLQANQTDWEFLMERARRINYRLYVEDNSLYFEPPPEAPPETALEWGIDLPLFRARLSTINQVSEVTVRGWDTAGKAPIVGTATSAASTHKIGESNTGGQMAQTAHSEGGKTMVLDQPVFTESEARTMAQALLDRHNDTFIEAEGQCGGNPNIKAGTRVKVSGVGPRFSGTYLVTRAVHHWSAKGYTTHFWCAGGNGSHTITDLLHTGHGPAAGQSNGGGGGKWTGRGLMVGVVTNNSDPDNRGRVKVKFPVMGDNVESYWCRMASTMAGPVRGIAMLPEANDEVVVAFANGDPNHGYVLGAVWNGSDNLPKPLSKLVTGSQTIRRVIRSRVGHEILIDDTSEPGGFVIIDKTTDNKIVINTQENKIQVIAKSDIEITSTQGKVKITGQQGVDIKGDPGAVSVESTTGAVDLKASAAKATLSGMTGVDIEANGGKVSLAGTAGVDVTSPATVNIKGLSIMLN